MSCGCCNPYRGVLTLTHEDKFFSGHTAVAAVSSFAFSGVFNTSACAITISATPTTVAAHSLSMTNAVRHLI